MSDQESGDGGLIPSHQYTFQGLPAARLADELEKLANAIRRGQVSHVDGGMIIQPTGSRIRITSNLELLVLDGRY